MIREKDEALAAKSAECANLKRELRASSSSSSSLSTPGSKMVHSNLLNSDLSDLKINLKDEGDPELYGHIDQVIIRFKRNSKFSFSTNQNAQKGALANQKPGIFNRINQTFLVIFWLENA